MRMTNMCVRKSLTLWQKLAHQRQSNISKQWQMMNVKMLAMQQSNSLRLPANPQLTLAHLCARVSMFKCPHQTANIRLSNGLINKLSIQSLVRQIFSTTESKALGGRFFLNYFEYFYFRPKVTDTLAVTSLSPA